MSALPESRSEQIAMVGCCFLTFLFGLCAVFPHEVAHFLIGLLP